MKKKILFMVSSMNIGGVEKSLLSLLDTISKKKYDITILMLNKSGGFLNFIPNHINVEEAHWFQEIKTTIMNSPYDIIKIYLKDGRILKIPSFIYAYYKAKITGNRYYFYKHVLKDIPINKEQYDVAIAYAGPTEIIDIYISHKVKARKKAAWIHFDVSKHHINEGLYRKLYRLYDKIFVVSNEAKEKFDEIIPEVKEKSEVMLNVISEDIIKKMSLENCELDSLSRYIKLVTVGRLSKEKGQDLAVEVLNRLKSDGIKIKWYCIGEGNHRIELKGLIEKYDLQDDFILLGAKVNPYPYVRAADIYVQTSIHEGYCLTLAEAKILNKPIITTDFTGAREQIEDDINGIIVQDNVDSIYEGIVKLLNSKTLKTKFANNFQLICSKEKKAINSIIDYFES